MTISNGSIPKSADLTDTFYYLTNARTVITVCRALYSDLLYPEEQAVLDEFDRLSTQDQALLIRMVMRTGVLFTESDLAHYSELTDERAQQIARLAQKGMVEPDPMLSITDLGHKLNKTQLVKVAETLLGQQNLGRLKKGDLIAKLSSAHAEPRRYSLWPHVPKTTMIELKIEGLFTRLRLMFFGNLRQSWSEFVITELGHQRYESVELTNQTRAFQTREEIELYLDLHHFAQALDAGELDPKELLQQLRSRTIDSEWLNGRKAGLLHQLGRVFERAKELDSALDAYERSGLSESIIRSLRVRESLETPDQLLTRAEQVKAQLRRPIDQLYLSRIIQRAAKRSGRPVPSIELILGASLKLELEKPEGRSIERALAEKLTEQEHPTFYVENRLINALFGLFFWSVIFAPVPGAFFNPFQSGPADLFRRKFRENRKTRIDALMDELETDAYRTRILGHYQEKNGITNALVFWPALTDELIDLSLSCIPAPHLKRIFERMLSDLRTHRSGFPDLIQFNPELETYRLIEVKGPGDRLQDNQKLWFDYFNREDIPVELCEVRWADQTARSK